MAEETQQIEALKREIEALKKRLADLEWRRLMALPPRPLITPATYYQTVNRNTTAKDVKYG
jgi:hypothetical protein